MMAMAVVNGGEISGSTAVASSTQPHGRGRPARTAVNANRKPSAVPAAPTSTPSSTLLPNARRWLGSRRTATSAPGAKRPPSKNARATRAASGKRTNSARHAHSTTTADSSAGSRRMGRAPSLPEIEHLVHPALHDPLAVGAGVGVVDREDLGALDERDGFRRGADALPGKADDDVVALGLGVERVHDEEDAAAGLAEADRQRAAAAALRVELHVAPLLLHVFEGLALVAVVD